MSGIEIDVIGKQMLFSTCQPINMGHLQLLFTVRADTVVARYIYDFGDLQFQE